MMRFASGVALETDLNGTQDYLLLNAFDGLHRCS